MLLFQIWKCITMTKVPVIIFKISEYPDYRILPNTSNEYFSCYLKSFISLQKMISNVLIYNNCEALNKSV